MMKLKAWTLRVNLGIAALLVALASQGQTLRFGLAEDPDILDPTLARTFVGPELDFDVQLVLQARDVPACQLGESASFTPRLGWNTWVASQPYTNDADEPVFEGEEVRWLNAPPALSQAG